MEIPIEIFSLFIGSSIALAIFGFLRNPQIPATLAFAGIFILTISVITTSIGIGYSESASINSIGEDDIDQYSQLTRTGSFTLRNGSNIFVGERANTVTSLLYNKDIDEICLAMGKTGNPLGNATIAIYNTLSTPTLSNAIYVFGTIDVSTLPTTGLATYCFENESIEPYSLFLNVAFGVFYNGGSVGNNVNLDSSASNPFDGTNTIAIRYQSSWTAETASDIYGLARLNIIVEDTENTISNNIYEFTEVISENPNSTLSVATLKNNINIPPHY